MTIGCFTKNIYPYFYRMYFEENVSLKPFNTFGIDCTARWFARFNNLDALAAQIEYIQKKASPLLILGGGSNILFTKNFDGYILKNELEGIAVTHTDNEHVYVTVAAGENWHRFVCWCIERNFAGLENLSLIPGNTGAGPMQNIGAYGVELKDEFHGLDAWDIEDKKLVHFDHAGCEFGYRESVFKRRHKGRFIICNIQFRLNKVPVFNTSYGAITQQLEQMGVKDLTIQAIANAVIQIRSSKLPDPAVTGNAGSFFKNPEVNAEVFDELKKNYPDMPSYALPGGRYKIPAGWLIEHSGPQATFSWKGYRRGDAGCHPKQALVLVNYANATGNEVYSLSEEILQSVFDKYGIRLEREVNIV